MPYHLVNKLENGLVYLFGSLIVVLISFFRGSNHGMKNEAKR